MDDITDAVVVGGGPGGLTAATWLARYRRTVTLIDAGEQRNRWVEASHGYFGADPAAPGDLLRHARDSLRRYDGVRLVSGRAEAASAQRDGSFRVACDSGETLSARRLVLATGVDDEFPDIPDFFDFYGRSIFHCPSCDGYEARNLPVVAIGWSPDVTGFALGLLDWAASVTVITDGRRFEGDRESRQELARVGVPVLEDEVVGLRGDSGVLEAVRLRQAGVVPCGMAFFSIRHHPRSDLARQLGCAVTDEGCISTDREGRTSVAGVYAAGDVTPGMQYVQTAAADGAQAGTTCALSLREAALGGADDWHDNPDGAARRH